MAEGPGKYDDFATHVREQAQAEGVIVIVVGGNKGTGFAAQLTTATPTTSMIETVHMLRTVADQIEADAKRRTS